MRQPTMVLALAGACLSGCSTPPTAAPTARTIAQDAVSAMGGREKLQAIQTIVMKGGTGSRMRLGQTRHVSDPETPGQLTNVVEIADLAGGRASLDYELKNGDFTQHRHEILTKRGDQPVGIEIVGTRPVVATSPTGLFSWGTQNSPAFLLRRNVVTIALAVADSAPAAPPTADKAFNGQVVKAVKVKTSSGEMLTVYFDPQSKLLVGFEVVDTETILGDVPAQYVLADYKAVDGVMLPHHITIRKGGTHYSDVQFAAIAINDPAAAEAFAVPESAAKEADQAIATREYSPLALTKVADGVYFARGYSHNSMIVEFPAWLAVVEAPYTAAQTDSLERAVAQQFPGKPIRYAAVTHHHYDHTGGVRAIAALGTTILVEKNHEAPLRELLAARHSFPQDELDIRRHAEAAHQTGTIEVYEGKKVIGDGGQRLELYAITGSPHVEPMVLAYVPRGRVLFQSDLWFPGTNGTGNPGAKHLLDSVRALKLRVDTNVGGHGGVAPFEELVKAIGGN